MNFHRNMEPTNGEGPFIFDYLPFSIVFAKTPFFPVIVLGPVLGGIVELLRRRTAKGGLLSSPIPLKLQIISDGRTGSRVAICMRSTGRSALAYL